jgi:hypothetical protein
MDSFRAGRGRGSPLELVMNPPAWMAAAGTPIVITEKCPYCSKPRNPWDILRFSSFTICQSCYEKHQAAVQALSNGQYTGGCSECGKSIDEIKAIQGGGDNGVKMVVHYENGIYRPMCIACDGTYVPKRRDLYGQTEFWKHRGL